MIFKDFKNINVGLEYEFQLVTEINGKLLTVYITGINQNKLEITKIIYDELLGEKPFENFLENNVFVKSKNFEDFHLDMGNLEISSSVFSNYNEAVNQIQDKLNISLLKILKNQFKSFALFLPAIYCKYGKIYWPSETLYKEIGSSPNFGGTKHINLDWNYDLFIFLRNKNYPCISKKYLKNSFVGYNENNKENMNFTNINCIIEIKVPYHFKPSENIAEWPNFDDIIIPDPNWRPLIGYYKNNKWIQIRRLI